MARGTALALNGCAAVTTLVGIRVAGCSWSEWNLGRTLQEMNPEISHSVAIVSRLVNVSVKIDVINKNSVSVLYFGIESVLGIGLLGARGVEGVWRQIGQFLRGDRGRNQKRGARYAARTAGG